MLKKHLVAAAAFLTLAVGVAAPTVPANAQNVCLRNNRIFSWNVVSPREMVVSDRQRNRFLVRLSGGCSGLDNAARAVAFRTATNLGCLQRGDRISCRDFALQRVESCFVTDVVPLGPEIRNRNAYNRSDRFIPDRGY